MGAQKQDVLADQYTVAHVATYAERDRKLTPENIMRHVMKLKEKSTATTQVVLKLGPDGIEVVNSDKTEVIESASWDKVKDHGMIIPVDGTFEQHKFLIFRIRLYGEESVGYQSQLLIFELESEDEGRNILNGIKDYKEHSADDEDSSAIGLGTISIRRIEQTSRHRTSPRKTPISTYGSTFYMLSRSLDDIERFGKRLSNCVQFDELLGHCRLIESEVHPQSYRALIECVRKIKFAMNLAQEFDKEAPESSRKIFVRLIKITFWLDEICQSKLIEGYDENAVRDVVEPLLNDATLQAIGMILPSDLQPSWDKLGPAWNTPSALWPNSLSTYMPQFKFNPRARSLKPEVLRHFVEMDDQDRMYAPLYGGDRFHERKSKAVPKATQPIFRNKDHERFYRKIQEHGGKLCFATVRHVCSKPSELYADQGEVFEVLEDSNEDWWTVENYSGESGKVPRWKLRPFLLHGSHSQLRYSEPDETPTYGFSVPPYRSDVFRSSTTSHPDSVFYPPSPSRKRDSRRPRSSSSHADTTLPPELLDPAAPDPLVFYLSPDQLKIMKSQPRSAPIIFMPWTGHHSAADSRPRLSTATPRPRSRIPDDRSPSRFTRPSPLSPLPRSRANYRPTIVLDSKVRPVVGN